MVRVGAVLGFLVGEVLGILVERFARWVTRHASVAW